MSIHAQGPIRAVLFDFDGTLTRPGDLDFKALRAKLACPPGTPVLEFIGTLQGPEQVTALATLDQFEYAGAERAEANTGAESLIFYLKAQKIPFGVASRNSRRSVHRSLENFEFLRESDFSVFITRESPLPAKPDPAPVLWAAQQMQVRVEELLVVGDFVFDVEAGRRAGALTVWLTNGRPADFLEFSLAPHHSVETLSELEALIAELLLFRVSSRMQR
jgi:hydrogenase expression/formation protein HypE